jgi:hypothetical protein
MAHLTINLIGERAARAQCLVLSIEIYGGFFRKPIRGRNFTDVNRVRMAIGQQSSLGDS